ncbi:DUF3710 domain-containing protein [Streptomyces sp. HUAS MG47]|uniref:DUF3710 domain-containing protein n=1 Tax=Streptomyces solicamelliae TaxID=3231716 RepID=UPI0038782C79
MEKYSIPLAVETLLDGGLELPAGEVRLLAQGALGDLDAARISEERRLPTLRNYAALLWAAAASTSRPEDEIDRLLDLAEGLLADMESSGEAAALALVESAFEHRAGPPPVQRVRDGIVGPWDSREAPQSRRPYLDLGGLKVPRARGVTFEPHIKNGRLCGTVLMDVLDTTYMTLEVFDNPPGRTWSDVLQQLTQSLNRQGFRTEVTLESLCPMLFAEVPETDADGGLILHTDGEVAMQNVRFAGCHGNGWLLRATLFGYGVQNTPLDDRIHWLFTDSIVKSEDGRVLLEWPDDAQ